MVPLSVSKLSSLDDFCDGRTCRTCEELGILVVGLIKYEHGRGYASTSVKPEIPVY